MLTYADVCCRRMLTYAEAQALAEEEDELVG
jgi:hypothetical protein